MNSTKSSNRGSVRRRPPEGWHEAGCCTTRESNECDEWHYSEFINAGKRYSARSIHDSVVSRCRGQSMSRQPFYITSPYNFQRSSKGIWYLCQIIRRLLTLERNPKALHSGGERLYGWCDKSSKDSVHGRTTWCRTVSCHPSQVSRTRCYIRAHWVSH